MREELNEIEAENILEADVWAFDRKRPLTTVEFAKNLHKRMFGRVWKWAGDYRTTDKNLGIGATLIPIRMYETMEQFQYWVDRPETMDREELAVRFHHALVSIHPFPNGNGRWSRLMGDLLAHQFGMARFSWGSANLVHPGTVRETYIKALRAADKHDLTQLLSFARS